MENISPNVTFVIMLVGMFALMFFMQRSQKKQAQKRMESLNKLQKGYEVITIGGLYGTVDEVDTEKRTIVLDVDGVYLTFELAAIKTVLPLKETASLEGAIEKEDGITNSRFSIKERKWDEKTSLCLFGKYLSQPYGRVCYEINDR